MWHVSVLALPYVVGAWAAHARHVDHFRLTHVTEDPATHAPSSSLPFTEHDSPVRKRGTCICSISL